MMRRWIDITCHVLHGCLAGLLSGQLNWFGLALAVFLYIQFLMYEVVEEKKIADELYFELKEWAVGYALSLTASLILKM